MAVRGYRRYSWAAAAALVLGVQSVDAADCSAPRKTGATMSETVYRGVENATGLLAKQRYDEAIARLSEMAEVGSDYERAIVNYNLGFAYSSKNDYAGAAKAFARALGANALPQQQHEQLQYNLGQLYIVAGQFDEGVRTLETYVADACHPVPADAHIFLANALSERKRYREALPQIDLAVSKAKSPKESWLQLKLAINYELKDYRACAETLVQLLGMTPDKAEYWRQLSSLLYEMKEDAQSLAVLALAERQGFLGQPAELTNLYNVYMLLDLPYKAGMLIQQAIDKGKLPADEKHLEYAANAWINARETSRAEDVLKKLAALSDKGEYYYRLGAMYGDEERWRDSEEVLAKAIEKGGLKHTGEAWMRLAVAQHGQNNLRGAVASLEKAVNYEESRKQAAEWLRHLGGQMAAN